MFSFIKKHSTHQTAVAHNGHVIVIEQGWFIRPVVYLDDERMFTVGFTPIMGGEKYHRVAKATTDDGKEVTYSVLMEQIFSRTSFVVEIFDGSWHGQKGQLIYSS